MPAAPLLQEGLGGGGHIAQAPITGQLLTSTVGLEVAAQNFDKLLRADIGNLADGDPGAEPVYHNAVVVTPEAQEVTADLLEGIIWAR